MLDLLLLDLTTHCDRHCPECCCGIHMHRKPAHHPWSYFERAAPFFCGIERVHLTGGEPPIHPQFAEFLPRFKDLFACRLLTMSTNGWGVERHQDVIAECVDEVYFTDYHARPGALDTLQRRARKLVLADMWPDGARHVSRSRRGSGEPCFRAYGAATYADGLLWGCCVAPGIAGTSAIPLTSDWREEMLGIPLPCRDCWFSP